MNCQTAFRICLVAGSSLIAGIAAAGPISYSESVSGDLDGFASPLTTFVFDVGTNTIAGTQFVASPSSFDFDSFAFQVPVGMEVVSARVDFDQQSSQITSISWQLFAGSANFGTGTLLEDLQVSLAGTTDTVASVPLLAGTYNVSSFTMNADAYDPDPASYTFT